MTSEKKTTEATGAAALPRLLSDHGPYAGTPGAAYVDEYCSGLERGFDAPLIAEAINGGSLVACPRCHFLSLAERPRFLDLLLPGSPPCAGPCDVCAMLPSVSREMFGVLRVSERSLGEAARRLRVLRGERARLLYRLWMGGHDGAEVLCLAAMAEGLGALRERVAAAGVPSGDSPSEGLGAGDTAESEAA